MPIKVFVQFDIFASRHSYCKRDQSPVVLNAKLSRWYIRISHTEILHGRVFNAKRLNFITLPVVVFILKHALKWILLLIHLWKMCNDLQQSILCMDYKLHRIITIENILLCFWFVQQYEIWFKRYTLNCCWIQCNCCLFHIQCTKSKDFRSIRHPWVYIVYGKWCLTLFVIYVRFWIAAKIGQKKSELFYRKYIFR